MHLLYCKPRNFFKFLDDCLVVYLISVSFLLIPKNYNLFINKKLIYQQLLIRLFILIGEV